MCCLNLNTTTIQATFFHLKIDRLPVTVQLCAMVQVVFKSYGHGTDFCAPWISPAMIDAVGPLVERERFDLVLTHLAGFRL